MAEAMKISVFRDAKLCIQVDSLTNVLAEPASSQAQGRRVSVMKCHCSSCPIYKSSPFEDHK
jgi:hypothetical protein